MRLTVHLDNFRYITGRGRDYAEIVEHQLNNISQIDNYFRDAYIALSTATRKLTGPEMRAMRDMFSRYEIRIEQRADGRLSSHFLVRNFTCGALSMVTPDTQSMIGLPLGLIHPSMRPLHGTYTVYVHMMGATDVGMADNPLTYVGMTSNGWQRRLTQHRRAAKNGSNTLFHRHLRSHDIVKSFVIDAGMTEAQANELEEQLVTEWGLFPKGLNMIPGGAAGIRFLHEHSGPRMIVDSNRKEDCLDAILRASKTNNANPALSARWWSDYEWAINMITAHKNRLKPAQIRNARDLLSIGHSISTVKEMIGARNLSQVARLARGATYSRIR